MFFDTSHLDLEVGVLKLQSLAVPLATILNYVPIISMQCS